MLAVMALVDALTIVIFFRVEVPPYPAVSSSGKSGDLSMPQAARPTVPQNPSFGGFSAAVPQDLRRTYLFLPAIKSVPASRNGGIFIWPNSLTQVPLSFSPTP